MRVLRLKLSVEDKCAAVFAGSMARRRRRCVFLKGSTRNKAGRLFRRSINDVAELIAAKSGRIRSLLSPEAQAFWARVKKIVGKRAGRLDEFGLDSLNIVELVMELEQQLGQSRELAAKLVEPIALPDPVLARPFRGTTVAVEQKHPRYLRS